MLNVRLAVDHLYAVHLDVARMSLMVPFCAVLPHKMSGT